MSSQAAAEGWRFMTFDDIPGRENLARLTLELMRRGMTNTDKIRDRIRRDMKLMVGSASNLPNSNPTSKYWNEHAWVIVDLQDRGLIEPLTNPPKKNTS